MAGSQRLRGLLQHGSGELAEHNRSEWDRQGRRHVEREVVALDQRHCSDVVYGRPYGLGRMHIFEPIGELLGEAETIPELMLPAGAFC